MFININTLPLQLVTFLYILSFVLHFILQYTCNYNELLLYVHTGMYLQRTYLRKYW